MSDTSIASPHNKKTSNHDNFNNKANSDFESLPVLVKDQHYLSRLERELARAAVSKNQASKNKASKNKRWVCT